MTPGERNAQAETQSELSTDRRRLLLSGASLLATVGREPSRGANPAGAAENRDGASCAGRDASRRRQAQHSRHLGRRHRHCQHQRLLERPDGLRDTEHRPHRQGRHQCSSTTTGSNAARRAGPRSSPGSTAFAPAFARSASPAHRWACSQLDPRSPACSRTSATPPASSARTTSATATRRSRPCMASTSSSAISITSTPRKSRSYLTTRKTRPSRQVRTARRAALQGDGRRRSDGRSALGQGRQADDRGYRPADQEAHGDDRRRDVGRGHRFHAAPADGRQALLLLVQRDAHAFADACARRTSRPGHTARHSNTPTACWSTTTLSAASQSARRDRHRRQHHRRLRDRQRPAHEYLAGRRHDAGSAARRTPTGKAPSASPACPLAGQYQAGQVSNELASHSTGVRRSCAMPASRTSRGSSRRHHAGDMTFKVHLDGYNQLPYLTGRHKEKSRAQQLLLFRRRRPLVAYRFEHWKYVFRSSAQPGTMLVWARAVHQTAAEKIYDLHSKTRSSAPTLRPIRFGTGQLDHVQNMSGAHGRGRLSLLESYKEFPPRSVPAELQSGEHHE